MKSLEKIIEEHQRNIKKIGALRGTCYCPTEDWLRSALKSYALHIIEQRVEERDSESFEKELDAPSSDWTHGHARGFNAGALAQYEHYKKLIK